MINYEQLYYDSQYEIKKLKERIQELEETISTFRRDKKSNIILRQEIIKEIKKYYKKEGEI